MKIALVTSIAYKNGNPEYVKYTNELKRVYCDKWGWDFQIETKLYHPEVHPVWNKLPVLLRILMRQEIDWAIWMDADATPVNMNKDISSYLAGEEAKVILAEDVNGINCGVFAVPNTRFVKGWLQYIEARRSLPQYKSGWKEQTAMRDSFMISPYCHIWKTPPKNLGWNNYLDIYPYKNEVNLFKDGDWCLHVPGASDEQRNEIFRQHIPNP